MSWGAIATFTFYATSTAMMANSIMQMIQGPVKLDIISPPGALAAKGLSPAVATALQRQQAELEALRQEAFQKEEELKKLEAQTATKEKIKYSLSKYGPFLVAGGAVLVVLLVVKKKKKR